MINNNKKSINKISYEGNIVVSVIKGDKVVRRKLFTNNGRWPLFRHIMEALRGNYSEADLYRPIVLGVYSIPFEDTNEGDIPEIADDAISKITDEKKLIKSYAKKKNIVSSSYGMFMTEPKIKVDSTQNIGDGNITYTFLIPFTALTISALDTGDKWHDKMGFKMQPINLVGLYGKNNAWNSATTVEDEPNTYGNPSAYFFVANTDPKMSSKLGSLIPKDITALSAEYSLKIEWTLSLSNTKSATKNN